ncbi:MAG: 50S ribosomal protein L22 [Deltaproteobacteria bacterium]|nr:50S ribosomal protein L22 [Deltaproteobacteria bacterium]
MKAHATWKYARIAPRKAREVADAIRGRSVGEALVALRLVPRKASGMWKKVLESAVANLVHGGTEVDVDNLVISQIRADKAVNLRRFTPRAMGRATRINKYTSHLMVEVSED